MRNTENLFIRGNTVVQFIDGHMTALRELNAFLRALAEGLEISFFYTTFSGCYT